MERIPTGIQKLNPLTLYGFDSDNMITISFCPDCEYELKVSGRITEDGQIKEYLKCPICKRVKILNIHLLEK